MHFYHQDNVFCNPPEGFRTNVEIEFPLYLPPEMPPLSSDSNNVPDKSVASDGKATTPCWSVGGNESTNEVTGHADLPSEVNIDNVCIPNIDIMGTKFGMSYTTAHVIETKLAKMLNDIQAPKTMYCSILQWGREAYTEGYDFVPRHGNKESLISSLQTRCT